MASPKATPAAPRGDQGSASAVPFSFETLKERKDFLAAAKARKWGTKGLFLQARNRTDGSDSIRVGYTCSKKIGNAVTRNRAKRRLRELARAVLADLAKPGWDYVLVGKAGATTDRDFTELQGDLRYALKKVHA